MNIEQLAKMWAIIIAKAAIHGVMENPMDNHAVQDQNVPVVIVLAIFAATQPVIICLMQIQPVQEVFVQSAAVIMVMLIATGIMQMGVNLIWTLTRLVQHTPALE